MGTLNEKNKIGLLVAIFLVSGSMIGSGIFIVSPDIARNIGGAGWLLLSWVVAGAVTIMGALCVGELASMFPKAGGQYIYLKEAFNPLIAFLYGWTLFLVVQCGTIAAVAVGFAKYSGVLVPAVSENNILMTVGNFKLSAARLLGVSVILFLTYINSRGINYGKFIATVFTITKISALVLLVMLGIFVAGSHSVWSANMADAWNTMSYSFKDGILTTTPLSGIALLSAFGVGMVGSLFSCDAWNNITFIAGEIENPKRNIPLSLFYGTGIVIALYILANVAYISLLPVVGDPAGTDVTARGIMFAMHDRVGTAAATVIFGSAATLIMAVLIIISTFGCNNGIILQSSRLFQAMAKDGLFFEKMQHNNSKGVPALALLVQGVWASVLCLSGKYGDLLDYVMFAVMLFYIFAVTGVLVLRKKQPDTLRPYKVWGYPLLPVAYIIITTLFCLNLLWKKPEFSFPGLIIVALGIPVYFYWRSKKKALVD